MSDRVKWLWPAAKVTIGLLLLYLLFKKVGFGEIYRSLLMVKDPLVYIPIALLIFVLTFMVEAMCLYILLAPIKKVGMLKLFGYVSASWSFGLIIPTADIASLTYMLKKEDINLGQGLTINFLNKAITAAILFALATAAFLKFLPVKYLLDLGLGIITIIIALACLLSGSGRKLIRRFILGRHAEKFNGFHRTLMWYLTRRFDLVALNGLLTILKLYLIALMTYVMILSIGANVPITDIMLISSLIMIVTALPSPLRFAGIREFVNFSIVTIFYGQIGVPAAGILSVYIITTLFGYAYAIPSILLMDHKTIAKNPMPKSYTTT